jgi:molybdate transport system ATP-binding protein
VLVAGRVVQAGRPEELIAAPATPFVGELAGTNLLPGTASRRGDELTVVALEDGLELVAADAAEGDVNVLVHPWDVSLARTAPADSMQNHVRGEIESLVPVGNRVRVRVGRLTAEITSVSARTLDLREGQTVVASFKATGTRLMPR